MKGDAPGYPELKLRWSNYIFPIAIEYSSKLKLNTHSTSQHKPVRYCILSTGKVSYLVLEITGLSRVIMTIIAGTICSSA